MKQKTMSERERERARARLYSRGAPSAISIAVIPNDQISLCEREIQGTRPFHFEESSPTSQWMSAGEHGGGGGGGGDNWTLSCYPVVVCGVWVLVAGDDLRCHPVWRADEGVPATHCAVQLRTHAKVDCEGQVDETVVRGGAPQPNMLAWLLPG